MNSGGGNGGSRVVRRTAVFGGGLLVAAVLAGHGMNVNAGLFIDDFNHAEQCRELRWTLPDLARGFEFDFTGRILPAWWSNKSIYLHYFRPFTVAAHKLMFDLFGLDGFAHHLFSLAWHLGNVALVYAVARHFLRTRRSAFFAAAVFALHPANALAVQWCAAASEPMAAFWCLLCVLGRLRSPSRVWQAVSYISCALALLSRENAVMLPLVIVALDLLRTRTALSSPDSALRTPHSALVYFVLAAALLITRWLVLDGWAAPPAPYFHSPGEPGFVRHILLKGLIDLAAVTVALPAMPVLSETVLGDNTLFTMVVATVSTAVAALVVHGAGRTHGTAFWIAWFALFAAPSLPMFAASHYLYLPSVAWAMLLGAVADGAIVRRRRAPVWIGSLAAVGFYGCALVLTSFALRAPMLVGNRALADVVEHARDLPPGSQLFFINLPVAAHEILPAVRTTLDRPDLRGAVITFAGEIIGPRGDFRLRRLDDRTLELRAEPPYFAGRTGRVLLTLGGRDHALAAGERFVTDEFEIEIVQADADGVHRLRVRFRKPLDSPDYAIHFGSERRGAMRLRPEAIDDSNSAGSGATGGTPPVRSEVGLKGAAPSPDAALRTPHSALLDRVHANDGAALRTLLDLRRPDIDAELAEILGPIREAYGFGPVLTADDARAAADWARVHISAEQYEEHRRAVRRSYDRSVLRRVRDVYERLEALGGRMNM